MNSFKEWWRNRQDPMIITGAEQRAQHEKDLVLNMADDLRRTGDARDAANKMKLIGTVGGFALWAISVAADAVIPYVTVPTRIALHALSHSSEMAAKIAALFAGLGLIKGTKNNMEYGGVRRRRKVQFA